MSRTDQDKWATLRDLAELSAFACLFDLTIKREVTPRVRVRFGDVLEIPAPYNGSFLTVFFDNETSGAPILSLIAGQAALVLSKPGMKVANEGQPIRIYFGDKIEAAAIKYEENILTLPAPAHHRTIAKSFMGEVTADPTLAALFNGAENVYLSANYGFITNTGKFLTKREAYELAILSRQLKGYGIKEGELFSEDLW